MVMPRSHYVLGGSGTTPRQERPENRRSTVNAPVRPRPKPRRAVRREQLSDEVAARLRTDIMTGTLRPGTFIRLDETAAQLGVSITPVREALRTLRGEGMVELEPHRGHVVVPLTRGDIEDIFWLQATIAKELAATAARRITDAEIDELERLNDALAAAVEDGDAEEIAAAEFMFHRAFNRTTGRIKLAWFLLHVARYLPGQVYASDGQWGVTAVAGHRELIAALRRRDVDAVVRLTNGEFADGAARLIARLEEIGLWS
jgi:DNA-binding GntR family transcriptional regulator